MKNIIRILMVVFMFGIFAVSNTYAVSPYIDGNGPNTEEYKNIIRSESNDDFPTKQLRRGGEDLGEIDEEDRIMRFENLPAEIRERVEERRMEIEERIQEKRVNFEEKKIKLGEKKQERVKGLANSIFNRFNQVIDRLNHSVSKIEEKIASFEERLDIELTQTRTAIDLAYDEIENVSDEILASKSLVEENIEEETSSEELREIINSVKESIKTAHVQIKNVIQTLREELPTRENDDMDENNEDNDDETDTNEATTTEN